LVSTRAAVDLAAEFDMTGHVEKSVILSAPLVGRAQSAEPG
jgi:hypothetical protein